MNTINRIMIHSLEQGYVVTDYISGKKYAVESPESVLRIVGRTLGMTEALPGWLMQPEKESSTTDQQEEHTKTEKAPVPNILKKDILMPRFEYDHSLRKPIHGYKNTWYAELPDGRIALGYGKASYYTTKEKIMQLLYPSPHGYFKESGVSTTAQTCLIAYRKLLAEGSIKNDDEVDWTDDSGSVAFREHEKRIKEEVYLRSEQNEEKPEGDENGSCDDITFDSCANNSPENCKYCVHESRFEDRRKILANKPSRPLLRATIGE